MTIPVSLFIFDLDGTLIDSRADIALAANLMLKEMGFEEIPLNTVVSYIGEGVRLLVARALSKSSPEKRWTDSELDQAVTIFRKHYGDHLLDSTVMYPNVKAVLEALRGKKKAVISNKPVEFSNQILEMMGIREHFVEVLGGDSLAKRKPDPEPVLHLLAQFDLSPKSAVMIGDSRTDIDCGNAAGVHTVGVTFGFRPRTELEAAQADIIIDDLMDLTSYFD